MSSSSSSSNRWTLALTVTLAVGAMGVCYYLWNTSKTSSSSSSSSSSDKKDVPPGGTKPATTTSTTASSGGPEDPAKRAEYEEAIRLAKKSMGSNDYAAAAERYGQAIALVEKHLPSCTKDVMTLYNNRSAMYEKAGDVEKALRDILVVLSLDPVHLKARVRRARIYEQQGKGYEALDDYVVTMFIERAKGLPPTTSQKADEVCKQVASKETALLLAAIRDPPSNAPPVSTMLPTKSYCRTFFEALPALYRWQHAFKAADRDAVVARWKAAAAAKKVGSDKDRTEACVAALELACFDLAAGAFGKGFDTVNAVLDLLGEKVDAAPRAAGGEVAALLCQLWTLKGVQHLLMRRDRAAVQALDKAVTLDPTSLDAHFALALCHLEMVDLDKAEAVYDAVTKLAKQADKEATAAGGGAGASRTSSGGMKPTVREAWVHIHRTNLWIARKDSGNFRPDAIERAMKDIDAALAAAGNEEKGSADGKAARMVAMLKTVTILSQIKAQTGVPPSSDDQERIRRCVLEAKKLFPAHEAVLMLEADMTAVEGNVEEALKLIDKVLKKADKGDSMPVVIKANVLMQKAFARLNASPTEENINEAQQILTDVQHWYQKAIETEGNALEAMAQCAQLKSMLGLLDEAVELTMCALSHARNREEIQELMQLMIYTRAQAKAAKEIEGATKA